MMNKIIIKDDDGDEDVERMIVIKNNMVKRITFSVDDGWTSDAPILIDDNAEGSREIILLTMLCGNNRSWRDSDGDQDYVFVWNHCIYDYEYKNNVETVCKSATPKSFMFWFEKRIRNL